MNYLIIAAAKRWGGPLIALFAAVILAGTEAEAARAKPEKLYQALFAVEIGGSLEQRLADGTRCDIVSPTHAIEVEFADKWAEAIGQSLHYALQTGKRAGIALILESEADYRYWLRLNSVILHHGLPIDTWPIKAFEEVAGTTSSAVRSADTE